MSGKKKKAKVKKVVPVGLSKFIRDELRMTCVLKGFSHIKCGVGKKLKTQEIELGRFFHGHAPNHPSQIKLLADASYNYRDLYDEERLISTKKTNNKQDIIQYTLKSCYTRGSTVRLRSGIDITHIDLEKRLRTSDQLIAGRTLIEMARNGVKHYKKALSFLAHKWNLKTNTPIDSGGVKEDAIEYVRCRMYKLLQKSKGYDDGSEVSDESDDADIEEVDKIQTFENQEDNNDLSEDKNTDALADREKNEPDPELLDFDDVPQDYVFPSYYAFITYGPFADATDQLSLLLTDDENKKKGEGTRAQSRKAAKTAKDVDSGHSISSIREFSTDQRIEIEFLDMQQQAMLDRRNVTSIIALSIEERAIARQLEAAEKRAVLRCHTYSKNNVHWQRVDTLIEDQQCVMDRIKSFNIAKSAQLKDPKVSEFLNQPNPRKNYKKRSADEIEI